MINIIAKSKCLLAFYYIKLYDGKIYISSLSKYLKCTDNHMVKLINILVKNNFISFKIEGRKKLIYLTDKGNEISDRVLKILTLLGEIPVE